MGTFLFVWETPRDEWCWDDYFLDKEEFFQAKEQLEERGERVRGLAEDVVSAMGAIIPKHLLDKMLDSPRKTHHLEMWKKLDSQPKLAKKSWWKFW